jgi:hypothetical protein
MSPEAARIIDLRDVLHWAAKSGALTDKRPISDFTSAEELAERVVVKCSHILEASPIDAIRSTASTPTSSTWTSTTSARSTGSRCPRGRKSWCEDGQDRQREGLGEEGERTDGCARKSVTAMGSSAGEAGEVSRGTSGNAAKWADLPMDGGGAILCPWLNSQGRRSLEPFTDSRPCRGWLLGERSSLPCWC